MIRYCNFLYLIVGFSLLAVSELQAQSGRNENAYSSFDRIIGLQNTDLFNGKEYIEKHIVRNEQHKFLFSPLFSSGVVIYEGQPYYDIALKYNVYDDLLLINVQSSEGERSFQLHNSKVDGFTIHDREFVHITSEKASDLEIQGFYELLLEATDFRLLKKHKKKRKKLLDRSFTYYEFDTDQAEYIVEAQNRFEVLTSRRVLLQMFPDHKREIRLFYRNNKELLKDNPDQFYIHLMEELATLVSRN